MVAVQVEAVMDDAGDRAVLTITGLGVGDSSVSLWRLSDGGREEVSGYRRARMSDASVVTDFYCPVGRDVSYEVEVISGPLGASRTTSAPVFIPATSGWLMDALVPQNSVRVVGSRDGKGNPYLRAQALSALEYNAKISVFEIMGSDKPMALFGQRMAEAGLDTSLATRSDEENARLKKLLRSTAQLVFRPLPTWGDVGLPGVMHLANATARQVPVNTFIGGDLTWWDIVSDVVAAPSIRVLTASFSYGDVAIMTGSYGQKQDAMAGRTYLDDLKSPLG